MDVNGIWRVHTDHAGGVDVPPITRFRSGQGERRVPDRDPSPDPRTVQRGCGDDATSLESVTELSTLAGFAGEERQAEP